MCDIRNIAANYYEKFVFITNVYSFYEITNAPLKITNMNVYMYVFAIAMPAHTKNPEEGIQGARARINSTGQYGAPMCV